MNSLTSSQFVSDMGISVKRIALLDEAALGTLAELGGLDSDGYCQVVRLFRSSYEHLMNILTKMPGLKCFRYPREIIAYAV